MSGMRDRDRRSRLSAVVAGISGAVWPGPIVDVITVRPGYSRKWSSSVAERHRTWSSVRLGQIDPLPEQRSEPGNSG